MPILRPFLDNILEVWEAPKSQACVSGEYNEIIWPQMKSQRPGLETGRESSLSKKD